MLKRLECGGVLISHNGTIRFPESNSTQEYSSNANCAWTIEVNSSLVINLTFIWIDIEKSRECKFDFVEVKFYKCYYLHICTIFSDLRCFR